MAFEHFHRGPIGSRHDRRRSQSVLSQPPARFSASITMGLVRKGPAALAEPSHSLAVNPPLAKPPGLPIRSDVVGTLSSGILDLKVSPQRIALFIVAQSCRDERRHRGRGTAWAWDGHPPYRLDRPPPDLLVEAQKHSPEETPKYSATFLRWG